MKIRRRREEEEESESCGGSSDEERDKGEIASWSFVIAGFPLFTYHSWFHEPSLRDRTSWSCVSRRRDAPRALLASDGSQGPWPNYRQRGQTEGDPGGGVRWVKKESYHLAIKSWNSGENPPSFGRVGGGSLTKAAIRSKWPIFLEPGSFLIRIGNSPRANSRIDIPTLQVSLLVVCGLPWMREGWWWWRKWGGDEIK